MSLVLLSIDLYKTRQTYNGDLFVCPQVQSMGRSIAEVQVCGVKAAATGRPRELSLSLSVHSLLLVDALQTYGPDFELLVASHKHVGYEHQFNTF